jgi:hypothetical protein
MKHHIAILIFCFLLVSCSQVENIKINFYPAFIHNSSLNINADSIELSITELSFKETKAISGADYKKIIKFLKKYERNITKDEDALIEDGITVIGSLIINGLKQEFDFVSPSKGTDNYELCQLLLSTSERHFKKQTSLNYLSCLSEYFSFSLKHHSDSCETFSYSEVPLSKEGKMVRLNNDSTQIEVYLVCDTMPEFPGGSIALKKYLDDSSLNNEILQSNTEEIRIYVSIIVLKNGKVANIEFRQNINSQVEKEIIKIFESMPTWKPGIIDGESVNVEYLIPIKVK